VRFGQVISAKIFSIVLVIFLTACASTPEPAVDVTPQWSPAYVPVDGSVSPQLRELVKKGTTPKVVLRVPNTVSSIVQSDTSKNTNYDALYGRIERRLVSEGFAVRDRALLQSLMSSGMSDYAAIGKRIDTDLIIEISRLSFTDQFQTASHYLDNTGNRFDRNKIFDRTHTNAIASMDLRIIQVKTGNVAAIITLKVGAYELDSQREFIQTTAYGQHLGNRAFGFPPGSSTPGMVSSLLSDGRARIHYLGGYEFSVRDDGGYILARNRGVPALPDVFFYVNVGMEKAVDKLAKLLVDRLRGDI